MNEIVAIDVVAVVDIKGRCNLDGIMMHYDIVFRCFVLCLCVDVFHHVDGGCSLLVSCGWIFHNLSSLDFGFGVSKIQNKGYT